MRFYSQAQKIPTGQSMFSIIEFTFSKRWEGFTKIAQFKQKSNIYNVAITDDHCYVPSELLVGKCSLRIKGYSKDQQDVIATANELILICVQGFESGGIPPVPPTPDLYQKLVNNFDDKIGDLSDLVTDNKNNLVEAINEAATTGGGGTGDHTKLKNRDAKDQHPMSAIVGLVSALEGKQPAGKYLTPDNLQSATGAALAQAKASGEFDGAKGDKGDPGEKGDPGDKGDVGATGAPGKDGTNGITPTIGANGNWHIGNTDTGKPSRGEKGDAGGKGDTGKAATIQVGKVTTAAAGTPASVSNVGTDESAIFDFTIPRGDKGAAGADGVTPHIGDNGNWYIGLTDTGKPSRGAAGVNGKNGAPGKDGAAGSPGITPNIGANGNWYLGTTDTGKPSRGETGLQGPVGPVGPQGPQGEKGADGKTPVKGTDYWTAADKQEIIDDIHPAYYIDLAGEYPNYTCPVAMADIKAAYETGKMLECRCAMEQYTATLPLFMPMPTANTWIFSGSGALTAMNFTAQSLTIAIVNGAVQASNTRLASMAAIPTALKNPNALTIKIGSTIVTYDGSSTQTVEIADGTEVEY